MLDYIKAFTEQRIIREGLEINRDRDIATTKNVLIREARKRGWTSEAISREITYFTKDGDFKGAIVGHTPQTNSYVGWLLARRKDLTKKALRLSNIPSPESRAFTADQQDDAREFFTARKSPLVIKPSRGTTGRGITMAVDTEEHFEIAWQHAADEDGRHPIVLLEELVHGLDIRVVVVDGKARAAATRIPPFVVGDGHSSFGELVARHREDRNSNGYLRTHRLDVDEKWIEKNGWDESSKIPEGEVAFLRLTSNASRGGFIVNVLPLVSDGLLNLAERAAQAGAGLGVVGVDLMVTTFESAENACVLELNASPQIEIHHFPTYGIATDVAFHVMNHLERNALR